MLMHKPKYAIPHSQPISGKDTFHTMGHNYDLFYTLFLHLLASTNNTILSLIRWFLRKASVYLYLGIGRRFVDGIYYKCD